MAVVVSVAAGPGHRFSKPVRPEIHLLAGLGIEGDAHQGTSVKHRSRVARDRTKPNLRQVHLVHAELFDDLARRGLRVEPGDIGENILTRDLDLLALPRGTLLRFGLALLEVTGLRNPCAQLDHFQPGLMAATLDRAADGTLIRKAGIMAIVLEGGTIRPGDLIAIELPADPVALQPV